MIVIEFKHSTNHRVVLFVRGREIDYTVFKQKNYSVANTPNHLCSSDTDGSFYLLL